MASLIFSDLAWLAHRGARLSALKTIYGGFGMDKRWVTIFLALNLSACGSETVRQSAFDIEQRRQIQQENAAKEARVRQEQDQLERTREQQRKREEATKRAAQSEVPVIRPLEANRLKEQLLANPEDTQEHPGALLAERTIYYEYDAYNVKEEYRGVIETHAKFLQAHRDLKLRVEGNCDERGSREYNLALGQRRADSVKRALTLLGVPASQIETVSFGSEKPKATNHDEQAYADNRRSDLMYSGPKSASQ